MFVNLFALVKEQTKLLPSIFTLKFVIPIDGLFESNNLGFLPWL